ncbi:MBL fold metallo-hydrolase [Ancylobacter pratisalsi]|uniref:MBL fold metallo-hydrolase n=1 Tax=Ancylobacter pratisalsi TaxID=1745854 RepID=A0A6P1YIZ7_9HYPH|nr:MBL fold metallo-hydrolase [Ancylobacter pratisalsi]QIB33115.1 MBL fold metallo-hydrolase [Ancylobacter pratisalsi]
MIIGRQDRHHRLPRRVARDILWAGGCMELELDGELVHSHFGIYALRGTEKTMLIDTGHPIHAERIDAALDGFLGGRELDYIFVTHAELPHCGLLPKWMAKYPQARLVGDVRDYPLYYPEIADRILPMKVGESVDLGGRRIVLVPAIWCDLKDTLWAFDTADRMLFVADGFSITHHHKPGTCGLTTQEQPLPDVRMLKLLNELALQWVKYTDAERTYAALDELLAILAPRYIAPAHGALIDAPGIMLPIVKRAMAMSMPTALPQAS